MLWWFIKKYTPTLFTKWDSKEKVLQSSIMNLENGAAFTVSRCFQTKTSIENKHLMKYVQYKYDKSKPVEKKCFLSYVL